MLGVGPDLFMFYVNEVRPKTFLFVFAALDAATEDVGYPCVTEELYQTTIYFSDPDEAVFTAHLMQENILQGEISRPIHLVHAFGGHYRNRHGKVPTVNIDMKH